MIMMSQPRPAWRKSSYSNGEASCVEVAAARAVGVRDSKDPHGPRLTVSAGSWAAFTQRVRQGDASRLQRQQPAAYSANKGRTADPRCAPLPY
jgi:hypothetical protein